MLNGLNSSLDFQFSQTLFWLALLLFHSLQEFPTSSHCWFFTGVLSDNKSLQISRTLFSIITDICSAMVLIFSLISSSTNLFSNFLGTVPRLLTTIGITVNFIFHNFFSYLAKSRSLSSFSLFSIFTLWSAIMAKFTWWKVIFFLLIKFQSGLLVDFFVPQSPREFYAIHFLGHNSGLYVRSIFTLLQNFLWLTSSTQSYLLLYSFYASLLCD